MAFGLDDILGNAGNIAGYFAGSGDRTAANNAILDSIDQYKKLNPTITASTAAPSAYGSLDPATRAAQMDTLAELRSQIGQGGMDALDKARVADIQNATTQAGKVASAGAVQDASRRGLANSATSLVSGQVAGQQAAQAGQQAGTQAAAMAEQMRQNEIQQQETAAAQTRQQDQSGAAAQDAINKFNASQTQTAAQDSFNNAATRAGGIAGGNTQNYNAQMADAQRLQGLGKAVGTTTGMVADYFAPQAPSGGGAGAGTALAGGGTGGLPIDPSQLAALALA